MKKIYHNIVMIKSINPYCHHPDFEQSDMLKVVSLDQRPGPLLETFLQNQKINENSGFPGK